MLSSRLNRLMRMERPPKEGIETVTGTMIAVTLLLNILTLFTLVLARPWSVINVIQR